MSAERSVLERVFSVLHPLRGFLSLSDDDDDDDFMRDTLVGLPPRAAPVPAEVDTRQTESHVSLVHDVVGKMMHSKHYTQNVLCHGLWHVKSSTVNGVNGMAGIECAWPNAALNMVRGRSWELLHQRIGSQMMRYIMRETAVFVRLPNNCYLQVCGPALGALIKENKNSKASTMPVVCRARIFYDERFIRSAGFGRGDMLGDPRECQPRRKCARALVRKIFQLGKWRIPKFLRATIPLLCQLLRKHGKLRYGFWLKLHCPLVSLDSQRLEGYTPHRAVYKFVASCVTRLVPRAMWGCGENISLVRDMIDEFVRARRYDNVHVDAWSARWKTSACAWLPRNAPAKCRQMVRLWFCWLVNELMIPLIRNHFYVTESASHRNAVFYYRKPLWKKIVQEQMDNAPLKNTFKPVVPQQDQSARLRLQPKTTGVRPIVNLSSANMLLRPAFEVLRWELLHNGKAHLLGASVFNLNEAYARLLPFILRAKCNGKPLYFVKVDVKRSFDSIIQAKLCSLLDANVFTHARYILQRYYAHQPRVGYIRTTAKHVVTPHAQPLNEALRDRNAVLMDRAFHRVVERTEVEAILRHHITHNLIRLGNASVYLQEEGIPQGSVLSSLLCALYYGDMERHALADLLQGEQSVLVRFVDDHLFVTTSLATAHEFLNRFSTRAVRDYGVRINRGKSMVNFATANGAIPQTQPDNPRLPWCGVLIDTRTFEIFGDYSRYRGAYMEDTLTVSFGAGEHPGTWLRRKIKQYVQYRCISLLMDPRINSRTTVLTNVYQMFLLCAIKFHSHVRQLSRHDNWRFLVDVIADVIEYAHSRLPSSLKGKDVLYLGCRAFRYVLRKKHAWYGNVIEALDTRVRVDMAHVACDEKSALFCSGMLF